MVEEKVKDKVVTSRNRRKTEKNQELTTQKLFKRDYYESIPRPRKEIRLTRFTVKELERPFTL